MEGMYPQPPPVSTVTSKTVVIPLFSNYLKKYTIIKSILHIKRNSLFHVNTIISDLSVKIDNTLSFMWNMLEKVHGSTARLILSTYFTTQVGFNGEMIETPQATASRFSLEHFDESPFVPIVPLNKIHHMYFCYGQRNICKGHMLFDSNSTLHEYKKIMEKGYWHFLREVLWNDMYEFTEVEKLVKHASGRLSVFFRDIDRNGPFLVQKENLVNYLKVHGVPNEETSRMWIMSFIQFFSDPTHYKGYIQISMKVQSELENIKKKLEGREDGNGLEHEVRVFVFALKTVVKLCNAIYMGAINEELLFASKNIQMVKAAYHETFAKKIELSGEIRREEQKWYLLSMFDYLRDNVKGQEFLKMEMNAKVREIHNFAIMYLCASDKSIFECEQFVFPKTLEYDMIQMSVLQEFVHRMSYGFHLFCEMYDWNKNFYELNELQVVLERFCKKANEENFDVENMMSYCKKLKKRGVWRFGDSHDNNKFLFTMENIRDAKTIVLKRLWKVVSKKELEYNNNIDHIFWKESLDRINYWVNIFNVIHDNHVKVHWRQISVDLQDVISKVEQKRQQLEEKNKAQEQGVHKLQVVV
jgi:hypothetical protein